MAAVEGVDIVVCPPFLALQALVDSARGSQVGIYAQTMHEADSGAFTGEVSAPMLSEIDVAGVILGHSERRQYFGETDRALQRKVPKALEAGLVPILCVGETEDERERGETERKLRHQVQEGLETVPVERLSEVVVAYEPIWAIGTGRTATPEQAQEAVAFVRALVGELRHERRRAGADPLRRLGASPTTRPSCSRCPTSTARSSAARRSIPRTSPRSSRPPRRERPVRLPRRARRLGARARRPGQRGRARRHARCSTRCGPSTRTRR